MLESICICRADCEVGDEDACKYYDWEGFHCKESFFTEFSLMTDQKFLTISFFTKTFMSYEERKISLK